MLKYFVAIVDFFGEIFNLCVWADKLWLSRVWISYSQLFLALSLSAKRPWTVFGIYWHVSWNFWIFENEHIECFWALTRWWSRELCCNPRHAFPRRILQFRIKIMVLHHRHWSALCLRSQVHLLNLWLVRILITYDRCLRWHDLIVLKCHPLIDFNMLDPVKKPTRQWAAWTRQEEESFFTALRQVGKASYIQFHVGLGFRNLNCFSLQ